MLRAQSGQRFGGSIGSGSGGWQLVLSAAARLTTRKNMGNIQLAAIHHLAIGLHVSRVGKLSPE